MIIPFWVLCLTAQTPSPEYKLVFSDHFNDSLIDGNAWWKAGDHESCVTHGTGGCEEDMWYKPENVTVNNGNLKLTAKLDPTSCNGMFKKYTSGWVQTAANFKYGYYEIRAKVPEGNGFWPAFWFWSGNNSSSYQEIDVFEFCGCDCGEFQSGFYYETDNNGIAGDNTQHSSADINVGNNACNNFNIYGLEWTPSHIKFYLNGTLISSFSNSNNHNPMSLILNLAIGGCFEGCGWTYCGSCGFLCWIWDMDGSCHVTCGTDFPKTFEIDWIKGYQKENQAVYINGPNELCIGESFTFKAPNYPNATYDWVGSSGLQVYPSPWLNFDGGIWRTANVNALSPGLQTLTLIVSFPSGYVESKTYNINVQSVPPSPPSNVILVPNENDCCYNLYTPVVSGATSYNWSINNYYSYTTSTNYSFECLLWGTVIISVSAQNACGTSSIYSITKDLAHLDCWDDPRKLVVYPNPTSASITLKFLNSYDEEVTAVTGNFFITDEYGNTVLLGTIEYNLTEIEIQNIQNGLYHIIYQNATSNLSTTFLKNHGN